MKTLLVLVTVLMLISTSARAQSGFVANDARATPQLLRGLDSLGKADARTDISHGKLVIKQFGLPEGSESNYQMLLFKRYGILVDFVWGDNLSREQYTYWTAYNSISTSEIAKRFGSSVLDSASSEARRLKASGIELPNTVPHQDWPEAYSIQVRDHPAFPESLLVKGTFGSIDLYLHILKSGQLVDPKVMSAEFFLGPFTKEFRWSSFGDNDSGSDSIMSLLGSWIQTYIKSMRADVNRSYFTWYYEDTLDASYDIEVRPELEDSMAVEPVLPKLSPPSNLVGPKDLYEVSFKCWVDRTGKMVNHKLSTIVLLIRRPASEGEPLFDRYECSSESDPENTTTTLTGDTLLLQKFAPFIDRALAGTTFHVHRNNEYFKYFDIARVEIMFANFRN